MAFTLCLDQTKKNILDMYVELHFHSKPQLFIKLIQIEKKVKERSENIWVREEFLSAPPSNRSQSDCVHSVCRNSKANCDCEAVTFNN